MILGLRMVNFYFAIFSIMLKQIINIGERIKWALLLIIGSSCIIVNLGLETAHWYSASPDIGKVVGSIPGFGLVYPLLIIS